MVTLAVGQLAEQLPPKQEINGSNLLDETIIRTSDSFNAKEKDIERNYSTSAVVRAIYHLKICD